MKTLTANYKLSHRVKDEAFDVDSLHHYCLIVQVGIRDLQLCVVDTTTNQTLLLESFLLEDVKTINTRLIVLQKLFESHHLLMAGFWHSIKLSLKSHKFTIVPSQHFVKENMADYLAINSELKSSIEEVFYYKHISSNAVNVFAGDKKLAQWVDSVYPQKDIQVIHQGSAIIEGIMRYPDHTADKSMFCLIDRGVLHLVVTTNQKLIYYNQFAVRTSEDYLRYIMLVFKELELNQRETKLIVWGLIKNDSPHVQLLRKYIKNISFGGKPTFLKFKYVFDEVPDHYYFDLYNAFLCD